MHLLNLIQVRLSFKVNAYNILAENMHLIGRYKHVRYAFS